MVRGGGRNKEKRPVVVPPQPKGRGAGGKRSAVVAQTSRHRLTIEPNNSPARSYQQATLDSLRTSKRGAPSSDIPSVLEHQSCSTPAKDLVESSSETDSDNSGSSNDVGVELSAEGDIYADAGVEEEEDESVSVGKKRARGYAKPKVQRIEGDKKPIAFIYDGKVLGPGVATWFTPVMRNDMHGFWPRWKKDVPKKFKDDLLEKFKDCYEIETITIGQFEKVFFGQAQKMYRNFINGMKKEVFDKISSDDPAALIGSTAPAWMGEPKIWEQWVAFWNTPKEKDRSLRNKANRNSKKNGKSARHTGGAKSRSQRTYEKHKTTGKKPSFFQVVKETNMVKDPHSDSRTQEVANPTFSRILEEYNELYRLHNDGQEPVDDDIDWDLWKLCPTVVSGMKHGRVFGCGTTQEAYLKLHSSGRGHGNIALQDEDLRAQFEELRRKHADDEAEKKALAEEVAKSKEEVARISALNERLQQDIESVRAESQEAISVARRVEAMWMASQSMSTNISPIPSHALAPVEVVTTPTSVAHAPPPSTADGHAPLPM